MRLADIKPGVEYRQSSSGMLKSKEKLSQDRLQFLLFIMVFCRAVPFFVGGVVYGNAPSGFSFSESPLVNVLGGAGTVVILICGWAVSAALRMVGKFADGWVDFFSSMMPFGDERIRLAVFAGFVTYCLCAVIRKSIRRYVLNEYMSKGRLKCPKCGGLEFRESRSVLSRLHVCKNCRRYLRVKLRMDGKVALKPW